jgi:puromycin-sensitive aminopeptidase
VGNQWALTKAGKAPIAQFFTMLEGFRTEADRAVLAAITERLSWLDTHVLEDKARPAFERFVSGFCSSQMDSLGWDPQPEEPTDQRLRRAIVIGALGHLARSPDIMTEANRRLHRYMEDRTTLDPNLASIVAELSASHGDADLYERFLERKRSSAKDPEEEQRFLFSLAAFEDSALISRTLDLTLTDEVRPQDRAHLLARLLGTRASRLAAWDFVKVRWDEIVATMDPMLQQNLVRALSHLTPESAATEVRDFLSHHATEETSETVSQAMEQLAIDAASCKRLATELTAVLNAMS